MIKYGKADGPELPLSLSEDVSSLTPLSILSSCPAAFGSDSEKTRRTAAKQPSRRVHMMLVFPSRPDAERFFRPTPTIPSAQAWGLVEAQGEQPRSAPAPVPASPLPSSPGAAPPKIAPESPGQPRRHIPSSEAGHSS